MLLQMIQRIPESMVRLRAERLGALSKSLILYPETNLFLIEKTIEEVKPQFVVIDSIQTLHSEQVESAPGSVSQVRETAAGLVRYAKQMNCAMVLIGHVTKEGSIAGPRVLEHLGRDHTVVIRRGPRED